MKQNKYIYKTDFSKIKTIEEVALILESLGASNIITEMKDWKESTKKLYEKGIIKKILNEEK